ncbi:tyrosine-type recombinase/integrase [Streptomyces sp. NPDC049099]|uniref:tyrosine-type recombinase/integrase n=1 Tax=Streptomyces sp. NPDC049099 TaxID=3155768 RepID=UPI0034317808
MRDGSPSIRHDGPAVGDGAPSKQFAEPGADGRVFVGAKGATPRRNHFNGRWHKACAEVGIKGLRFHDLRHTGNTLASQTNAGTRELMTRLGHSSTRERLKAQGEEINLSPGPSA